MSTQDRTSWHNWAGNVRSQPTRIEHPKTESEVRALLIEATAAGRRVRVVGAGHSYTPLCATDGVLICLDQMAGVLSIDTDKQRALVGAGTPIRNLGDPLWRAGLCLRNQGDIDTQHIAGAVGTATHGSGITQQSFSGSARGFHVVLPSGEAIQIGDDDGGRQAAFQTSLGLLGVVTAVELQVRDAFALAERLEYWSLADVLERWEEEMRDRRHFSFFWMPFTDSPQTLFMETPPGLDMADRSIVKLYDEHPAEALSSPADVGPGVRRVDRPYRIYPDPDFEGEIVARELEYMVPFHSGKDAFLALRSLILERWPQNRFPIEVRSIGADSAYLSPFFERPSISISICGHADRDFEGFLRDVDRSLEEFEPRPHWGKLHYFDRERLAGRYPRYDDFVTLRRELDPGGLLLNDHLEALFL